MTSSTPCPSTLSPMPINGDAIRLVHPPFFLVGSVRSGTTMLRLMLDHHPQLACHFEYEFAVERMTDDGRFPEIEPYRSFLRRDRIFKCSAARSDESVSYRELGE